MREPRRKDGIVVFTGNTAVESFLGRAGDPRCGFSRAVDRVRTECCAGCFMGLAVRPFVPTLPMCDRYCLAAWETLCDGQQNTGYSVNGGFAAYALADPNYMGHLPDGLDFEPAALI